MLQSVRVSDTSNNGNSYLTDQRSVHADPLTPSSAISEFPESPSVYNHAFFSPRPDDEFHPDFSTTNYPFISPTSQPLKRRFLDDPSSSMLDLDEDVRFSRALSDAYDHNNEDEDETKTLEEGDGEPLARMSYLGPKMRFHSPAPWELEDEPVQEVDENESTGHSSFIGILIGGRAKGGQKMDHSSPRASNVGRPSVESSRSFLNPKRSFETSISVSHPRGALYALAQESLSTSSLSRPHCSEGLRGKFSFGKLRSHSPNDDISSSPYHSATRLPPNNHTIITALPPRPSYDTSSSTLDVQSSSECSIHYTERKQSLPFSDASTHPYANPDLVQSYPTNPSLKSSPHSTLQSQGTSAESNLNVTKNPPSAFLTKSFAKTTLVPETPTGPPKKQTPHLQARDISSPVHVQVPLPQDPQQADGDVEPTSPLPMGMSAIPAWSERGMSHGFTLISLEEARAQRTRLVPIQPHSLDLGSDGVSPTVTSFRHTALKAPTSFNGPAESSQLHVTHSSPAGAAQPRTRSISTGVKAKNVLQSFVGPKQPDRRGSEGGATFGQVPGKDITSASGVSGKSLKHKKSGFMRLFSGSGSSSDKEERGSYVVPPPIPVSPGGIAVPRHNPKLSSHRIPVPSLSPSLLEAVARHEGSHLGGLSNDLDQTPSRFNFNEKRIPPPHLSINVGSSSPTSAFSTDPTSPGSLFPGTSNRENAPQSAPPHVSDFPALKLRPISTLFSDGLGAELDMAKFSLDEVGPKETRRDPIGRAENERPRQHSLASSALSSAPSSATSFADSQLSPATSSYASMSGTAVTTPTTGGLMSPIGFTAGPWGCDYGAGTGTDGGLSLGSYSTLSPRTTTSHVIVDSDASTTIRVLQEHLENTNKMWQERVLDLENEISKLKTEAIEWKSRRTTSENSGCCQSCGKDVETPLPPRSQQQVPRGSGSGVMSRPRARTGGSSRFVNGQL